MSKNNVKVSMIIIILLMLVIIMPAYADSHSCEANKITKYSNDIIIVKYGISNLCYKEYSYYSILCGFCGKYFVKDKKYEHSAVTNHNLKYRYEQDGDWIYKIYDCSVCGYMESKTQWRYNGVDILKI